MTGGTSVRPLAGLLVVAGLVAVPAVAQAQSLDPSVLADTPASARALASVGLVGLLGSALLWRYRGFVDQAVDDTLARPRIAVFYGVFAYGVVLFLSLFALDIVSRVGVAGTSFGLVGFAILAVGLCALASLGYLVVGTLLVDLYGGRGPWQGLLLGAVLSGVGWLLLPLLGGLAVWLLVAAVGVGGPMRTWVHGERTVATEVES